MKKYNEYQSMHYKLTYSTTPKKREKITHWAVYYGNKQLTQPLSYPLCKMNLNEFKMQGLKFPNKELLTIKPAK